MKKKKIAKKGISDVVVSVLMILLVIAAVGIVWAFLSNYLNSQQKKFQSASDCMTVGVEITRVSTGDNSIVVLYNHGTINLMTINIYSATGDDLGNITASSTTPIKPGESRKFIATNSIPLEAALYAVPVLNDGSVAGLTCEGQKSSNYIVS